MKKTDLITVGVLGNVPTFFGKEATGYTIDLLSGAVLGRLIYVDNKTGKIAGGILESVTSPDRGKTWLLTLHEGQKFHDGSKVTIEDVEFAFGHILSCPYGTPDQSLLESIEGSKEIPTKYCGLIDPFKFSKFRESFCMEKLSDRNRNL